MRSLWALVLFSGCTFSAGIPAQIDPGFPDNPDGGMAGSGSGTVPRTCHVMDPDLRLCLDFDDPAHLGEDLSGLHHDAMVSNVGTMQRFSDPALVASNGSSISVTSPALDIRKNVSFEMWVSPTASQGTTIPLMNGNEYSLAIDQGVASCRVKDQQVSDPLQLPMAPQWTHVACTYDGQTLMLFVGGSVHACAKTDQGMPSSTVALAAGGYTGGIDDVHVFARTVAPSEICTHANGTVCNPICPPND